METEFPGGPGPQGPAGNPGPANTLTPGTITTLPAGSSASVTITGTAPNQTLNLSIPQGIQGLQGVQGLIPIYNSAGLMSNVKAWMGSGTTASNGQFTLNYSSAGFTNPPIVIPYATAASGSLSGVPSAYQVGVNTATSALIQVQQPAVAILSALTVQLAGAGITVPVFAIGT